MKRIVLAVALLLSAGASANLDGLSMSQITSDTQRWSKEIVDRAISNVGLHKEKIESQKNGKDLILSLQKVAAEQFRLGYLLAMDDVSYQEAREMHIALFTGSSINKAPGFGEQLAMDVKLLAIDAAYAYYENPGYFPK